MQNTEALNTADRSRHSSYREMLLEHLFVGEVMRHIQLKTSFEGSSGMQCNQQGGGLLSIQIAQIEDSDFSSDFGSNHDNVSDGSI